MTEVSACSRAELLLTSAGLTTDAMRERALEMRREYAGRKRMPRVLRIADGWTPFRPADTVRALDRDRQKLESRVALSWSNRYLRWTLGTRAVINTVRLGGLNSDNVQNLLGQSDMLVVPGGNTYQTMRSFMPHAELVSEVLASGVLPYIGDSAGSIVAGKTLKPASLEPADTCPNQDLIEAPALGLVDADIVVHAKGTQGWFNIPGPQALVARAVLALNASNVDTYHPADSLTPVFALNDKEALSVSRGRAHII